MNANVYPMSTSSDLDSDDVGYQPTPAPMPETATRRAVKSHKAEIARLKRQIAAEEKRIALARLKSDLEARLRTLRTDGYKTY